MLASAKVAIASQSASMLAGLAINISIGAPWASVKYLEYRNWEMWSCKNNCPGYTHTLSSFFGWSLSSFSAALFIVRVCNVDRLAVQILWTHFHCGGSSLQEGVKTENDHINLKVAGQDGSVVQFKIKRHTPLNKLMKAYCERQVSL